MVGEMRCDDLKKGNYFVDSREKLWVKKKKKKKKKIDR